MVCASHAFHERRRSVAASISRYDSRRGRGRSSARPAGPDRCTGDGVRTGAGAARRREHLVDGGLPSVGPPAADAVGRGASCVRRIAPPSPCTPRPLRTKCRRLSASSVAFAVPFAGAAARPACRTRSARTCRRARRRGGRRRPSAPVVDESERRESAAAIASKFSLLPLIQ